MTPQDEYINPSEPARNDSVSVGVTSVRVMNARTGRVYQHGRKMFVLRNVSDDDTKVIWLSFGTPAVVGVGIPLWPRDIHQESRDPGFQPFNGDVNAICEVAGGTLSVEER